MVVVFPVLAGPTSTSVTRREVAMARAASASSGCRVTFLPGIGVVTTRSTVSAGTSGLIVDGVQQCVFRGENFEGGPPLRHWRPVTGHQTD